MKKILSILASAFLVSFQVSGQTTDIELWTGAGVNIKMNKRLSFQPEQVFKFNDTISHFKSAYSDLGIKYKITKVFGVGANYRYVENPPDKNAQRFSGDLIFNLRKKDFPLSFQSRLRFQHEVRNIDKRKEDYLRNKFTLEYDLANDVSPYVSFEPFFRFNGKDEFRVMRYAFGIDWKPVKKLSVTGFYMLEKEINVKNLANAHVIGLMLAYNLVINRETK